MFDYHCNICYSLLYGLLQILPGTPAVEKIVGDLSDVNMKGCAFHWAQVIWRKVQDIGLRRAYIHDDATYIFIKKLMVLQLLPAEHIDPVFQVLKTKATSSKLQQLTTYIEYTWPHKNWSVYGQIVRTNNDL